LQGLIASATDLSEGGLAQALTESVLRFNMGARVWITEICERDGVDRTAALLSESTGRVLVSVGREDDVKFVGLCEARGISVLRIGVTRDELDGSVWADVVHSHLGGRPPKVDLAYEKKLAELLHGASLQGLIASAMDLSEGGLAQALTESVLRFNMGARVWLTEICERDGVDRTSALFSESTGRVLVSVGREDDVKFVGLCEARGIPVLRIGVTDDTDQLAIQDLATWKLNDLRTPWVNTLPDLFG
jgi:phosphoribosylformylglycinamidine (FGAM) synthase-like enzyme